MRLARMQPCTQYAHMYARSIREHATCRWHMWTAIIHNRAFSGNSGNTIVCVVRARSPNLEQASPHAQPPRWPGARTMATAAAQAAVATAAAEPHRRVLSLRVAPAAATHGVVDGAWLSGASDSVPLSWRRGLRPSSPRARAPRMGGRVETAPQPHGAGRAKRVQLCEGF